MGRRRYYEHLSRSLPDKVELCDRCKTQLVYRVANGVPACGCSETGEQGHTFIRLGFIANTLGRSYAVELLMVLGLPGEQAEEQVTAAQRGEVA